MRREDRYPETDTFVYYNRNPKNRLTSDCVVRAISTAMDIDYDRVLFEMAYIASETGYGVTDTKCVDAYMKHYGWKKYRQPRHRDNTKFTGRQFCEWLSVNCENGAAGYILCNIGGNHMVAIKPTNHDGINCQYKVHDIWDSTDGCIGNYWVAGSIEMDGEVR